MINVGIIGMGFVGRKHVAAVRKTGLGKIVAVADSNPDRLQDVVSSEGNLALNGDASLHDVRKYVSAEDLLSDPAVEAVIIALPTVLHRRYVLNAVKANKHILCEKPLALSTVEGGEILAALEGFKPFFMVGHCIRFWPAYARAREIVQAGAYGSVRWASFTRQCARPGWSAGGWMVDEQQGGGALLDLHVHDVDYVNSLLGKPSHIQAWGLRDGKAGIVQVNAVYTYADGVYVAIDGGWSHPSDYPFRMGYTIALEETTLEFDTRSGNSLHVYRKTAPPQLETLADADGFEIELRYFLSCIRDGRRPTVVTAQSSLEAVELLEEEKACIDARNAGGTTTW